MAILTIALAAIATASYVLLRHSAAIKEHDDLIRKMTTDYDTQTKEFVKTLTELRQTIGTEVDSRFSRSQNTPVRTTNPQLEIKVKSIEDRLLKLEQDLPKLTNSPKKDGVLKGNNLLPTRD